MLARSTKLSHQPGGLGVLAASGFTLVVKTFSKAAAERLRLIKRQLRLTSD